MANHIPSASRRGGSHDIERPIRVLVVDDDPGARLLHGRFVAGAPGFAMVAAVGTGLAAVAHGVRGWVDLVLLDMRLPDISGVEVLNRLRTLGDHSPDVLVISSSQDRVTVRQALAGHIVGYLVKPFTEEALLGRLAVYASERAAVATTAAHSRDVPLAQGEIDKLLSTGRVTVQQPSGLVPSTGSTEPGSLPKGVSQVTLDRVVTALDPVAPLTARTLAASLLISLATVRRYLDYLEETGAIDLAHRYGMRGRPEVLYRRVPPPMG